jgi:hypothetical protein
VRIIGLSGYAKSGKDTIGQMLVQLGYTRVAFADNVRVLTYEVDPEAARLIDLIGQGESDFQTRANKAKLQSSYVREALQRVGNKAREVLGEDIWIRAALEPLHASGYFVVTDVRYRNEVEAIVERGGKVVRVTRPDVGPANDHVSEHDLDDYPFDWYLANDGTLEQLQRIVKVWEEIIWRVPSGRAIASTS